VFNLELLAEAEIELAEAFEWYEEQLNGLGNKLYNEVSYYLSLIESNPYLFAIKYRDDLRSATLNKFPYLIIFWVDEIERSIYIVSIFLTKRNPKYF
jgi:toxin ParE1/3/4